MCTYHACLLQCKEIFDEKYHLMNNNINDNDNTHLLGDQENVPPVNSFATPARARRSDRYRQIDGVVPQAINFGARLQTKTPLKLGPMAKKGTLPPKLKAMIKECTGMPMKALPSTYGKCARCQNKSAWYCAGCKRWLCMERLNKSNNANQYDLYNVSVRGKDKTFLKMCFHHEHEAAWPKRHYCSNGGDGNVNAAPPSNN